MSYPITAHWRPASALPKVKQPTTILIAYPPCDDGGPRGWYLSAHIYQVMPGGAIVSEVDDHDPTCSNFFWVFESDLMITIDAALPLELKAKTLNHDSAWRDAPMFQGPTLLEKAMQLVRHIILAVLCILFRRWLSCTRRPSSRPGLPA